MKTVLLTLLIVSSLMASGQNLDSLKSRILAMETTQKQIQLGNRKAANQFRAGTLITVMGTATSVIGALMYYETTLGTEPRVRTNQGMLWLGLGLVTVGAAIQIDSQKHIRRANPRIKFTKR